MTLLHLALSSDWARASREGVYDISTLGATIAQVGYLHASTDRAQADAVARRFYAQVSEPILLLEIDETALAAHGLTVRREPAQPCDDDWQGQELFPHVYGGPLPLDAITRARPYEPPPA